MIKYGIISIDDSREEKKKNIRREIGRMFSEKEIRAVDGTNLDLVDEILEARPWLDFPVYEGVGHGYTAKRGELGVWLSTILAWESLIFDNEATHLILLEDDAMFKDGAAEWIAGLFMDVPKPFDFISLFVPENQKEDYFHFVGIDPTDGKPDIHHRTHVPGGADMWRIDNKIARSYQNYSNVAIMYSKAGAYKFLCEAASRGIDMPIDCFVHQISNLDHFAKYAPHPDAERFVEVDWKAPTTIHHTEVIDVSRVYGSAGDR